MAINQNHVCEELNGVKCAIVEKNATKERVGFLKEILAYNGFKTIVAPSPPPKPIPQSATATPPGEAISAPLPALPETFTVGVTNVAFNPINAIFGRLLQTPDGHVVTLSYWQQKEKESRDEIPYFES
jgi:hypothetical protein